MNAIRSSCIRLAGLIDLSQRLRVGGGIWTGRPAYIMQNACGALFSAIVLVHNTERMKLTGIFFY
ncbi:hypothetical protein B5F74_09765 [Collinsella sp. An271]|nr:hypothetical protein B5F74_09765 [Collinsella sp. An271]